MVSFIQGVLIAVLFTIYIHFERRNSYQKGFSDGVEQYSNMANQVLDHINKLNKEAEEAGMDFKAYVESIKPLNKAESEDKE